MAEETHGDEYVEAVRIHVLFVDEWTQVLTVVRKWEGMGVSRKCI